MIKLFKDCTEAERTMVQATTTQKIPEDAIVHLYPERGTVFIDLPKLKSSGPSGGKTPEPLP